MAEDLGHIDDLAEESPLNEKNERRQAMYKYLDEQNAKLDGINPEEDVVEEVTIDPVSEVTDEVTKTDPVKPEKTKIKVNGKEIELTYEELIERASKVEAADEYLRRSKEVYEQTVPSQLSERSDVDNSSVTTDEDDLADVRAIQMGTEEEALAVFRKLKKAASPSINVDEIASKVQAQTKFQAALSTFQEEYKDLFADPDMVALMGPKDDALIRSGKFREDDFLGRFRAVGDELRAKFGKTQAAPNEALLAKKIAAPQVPSSTTSRRTAEVEVEATYEETVEALREARRNKWNQK